MQFHPIFHCPAFHAPPGEEAALAVMRKNIAVMYFAEGQLQSAGEVLERKLGKERQVSRTLHGVLVADCKESQGNSIIQLFFRHVVSTTCMIHDT